MISHGVIALICTSLLLFGDAPASTARLQQAVALARAHRFEEASKALQGINAPGNPNGAIAFHRLRASINAGLKRYGDASSEIHAAAKLAPENAALARAATLTDLQWLAFECANKQHAALGGPLQAIHNLPPTSAEGRFARLQAGALLNQAGLYRAALPLLNESRANATQADERAQAEALLADAYEAAGDSLSAVQSYQRAVELQPANPDYRLRLGIEFLKHQTLQPAMLIFTTAVSDFPQSARLRAVLGVAYYVGGDIAKAETTLLGALSLDPSFRAAREYLAQIVLAEAGRTPSDVRAALCRFADDHPGDSRANATCGTIEVSEAEHQGITDLNPFLARLRRAAASGPKNALARCQYGRALEKTGQWAPARVELEACTSLDPGSVEGHFRLLRVYQRLGLPALAKKQQELRGTAEKKIINNNGERARTTSQFLYTLRQAR